MNALHYSRTLRGASAVVVLLVVLVTLFCPARGWAVSTDEAKVTKIVRDVKLLPAGAKAEPAALNDKVSADTGVRTGDRSRSELTFADLTIERLGSNTVFHFNKAGRVVNLDGGSVLLRVPKDSGGAEMQTRAVTVGVTGTTLILETTSAGRNKLIVLEGTARLSLRGTRGQSVNVHGGQMEDVPAGATKLPPPVAVNLNDIMQHHPLVVDFPPLPSRDLIYSTMNDQPVRGEPVAGGPSIVAPVIGNLIGGGGIVVGGGSSGHGRQPSRGSKPTGGQNGAGVPTTGSSRTPSKTPPPKRKPNTG
ncbi:MAG: FecR domain-containing protein [Chthoniobacterales bacterium]